MVQVPVYSAEGKELRQEDFDESIFGEKVLRRTLSGVIRSYIRNKRQGTHSTKTRSLVAGSNRKLWRQKGTGRARVGDRRPPHWRGGGTAHGPHTRDYWRRIPKRLRRTALDSALLHKFKDGKVSVVEGLDFSDAPRTSKVSHFLKTSQLTKRVLFALQGYDQNFAKSVRNIPKVEACELRELNAYDVLFKGHLVLTLEAFQNLRDHKKTFVSEGAEKSA